MLLHRFVRMIVNIPMQCMHMCICMYRDASMLPLVLKGKGPFAPVLCRVRHHKGFGIRACCARDRHADRHPQTTRLQRYGDTGRQASLQVVVSQADLLVAELLKRVRSRPGIVCILPSRQTRELFSPPCGTESWRHGGFRQQQPNTQ